MHTVWLSPEDDCPPLSPAQAEQARRLVPALTPAQRLEAARANAARLERNARLIRAVGPWVPLAVAAVLFGFALWWGGR